MFANRFTALIDACTLVDAARRDILLHLAEAELFRPRWSERILEETRRAYEGILTARGLSRADADARSERLFRNIETAFPGHSVTDYQDIERELNCLPDENDHHVLAAAIHCKSSVIVTENLRDFPRERVWKYEIDVRSGDEFIADTIDLDYSKSIAAIAKLRSGLKRNPMTAADLLERWRANGLVETVEILYPHMSRL
jgi:predicted nucleic acid-binding protein